MISCLKSFKWTCEGKVGLCKGKLISWKHPKRVSTAGTVKCLARQYQKSEFDQFLSYVAQEIWPSSEVWYLSHTVFLASVKRQVTPIFLSLSTLFPGLEMTTSMTGWQWMPWSPVLCQVSKAEVHALVGFSSSSSFRSRTSLQSYKEYLQTFIIKARIWLQKCDFPAAQLGPQYAYSTSPEPSRAQVSSYVVPLGLWTVETLRAIIKISLILVSLDLVKVFISQRILGFSNSCRQEVIFTVLVLFSWIRNMSVHFHTGK